MKFFKNIYPVEPLFCLFFTSLVIIVLLSLFIPSSEAISKEDGLLRQSGINLIPEPRECIFSGEYGKIGLGVRINMELNIDPFIRDVLEMNLVQTDDKKGIREIELQITKDKEYNFYSEECYQLEIDKKKIIVQASGNPGLFYGVQTLLQLVKQDGSVPLLTIKDSPDLGWRAIHIDTKHHQDRFEYYMDMIPRLAKYKINAIVFEIEDKLEYQKHPAVSAPGAFTKYQIQELALTARKNYIDFIPLVQGLGHVRYILKHPQYASLRELPESTWQFCPLKDKSFDVLFDLYDEAIEATGTKKYFHIGGDESYDLATCPDCQKKAEKIGREGVYLIWLKKTAEYLQKKGLTVIIWDDMVQKFDEKYLQKLPENVVYMRWNYGADHIEKTALFDKGYKCMVAPATQCTTPLFPDYEKRLENIACYTPAGFHKGAVGALCTAWDDSGLNFETFWYGFAAFAEYSWSGAKPGLDEFRFKFMDNFYGKASDDLMTVYNILSQGGEFWQNSRGRLFWKRSSKNSPLRFPVLPNEYLYFDPDWSAFTSAGTIEYGLFAAAQGLFNQYQQCENILLKNLENDSVQNKLNLRVLLSVARVMKYNTQFLKTRYRLGEAFIKASQFADQGNSVDALKILNEAEQSMAGLVDMYKNTRTYLEKVWEENCYPRDRSDLGRPMDYYVDPFRLHLAEMSANYDYLFWNEKLISMDKYLLELKDIKTRYKYNISRSNTKTWHK